MSDTSAHFKRRTRGPLANYLGIALLIGLVLLLAWLQFKWLTELREEETADWPVQYTNDPQYRDYTSRVGYNPLRIVARREDKLMDTDISIFTEDARILLSREVTLRNLQEGRVIIILAEDAL